MSGIINIDASKETKTCIKTCAEHGDYSATVSVMNLTGTVFRFHESCPKCRAESLLEKEAHRQRSEARRLQITFEHSGIPPRFLEQREFERTTEGQIAAFEFAREYAQNFDDVFRTGRSAIFTGGIGTGKTHLACAIACDVIENGHTARYSTMSDMFQRIKDTWRRDSEESTTQAINAFARVDLLVLDEVGMGYGSETEHKHVFEVIDRRYQNRRPTILISNLDTNGVKAAIGSRVYDRLREDDGQVVPFNWSSFRVQKNLK